MSSNPPTTTAPSGASGTSATPGGQPAGTASQQVASAPTFQAATPQSAALPASSPAATALAGPPPTGAAPAITTIAASSANTVSHQVPAATPTNANGGAATSAPPPASSSLNPSNLAFPDLVSALQHETDVQAMLSILTELEVRLLRPVEAIHQQLPLIMKVFTSRINRIQVSLDPDDINHKVRRGLLQVIFRLPAHESGRPCISEVLDTVVNLLLVENEQNALTCVKIILEIHKNYRPGQPQQINRFLEVLKSIFEEFPKTVGNTFGSVIVSQQPQAGATTQHAQALLVQSQRQLALAEAQIPQAQAVLNQQNTVLERTASELAQAEAHAKAMEEQCKSSTPASNAASGELKQAQLQLAEAQGAVAKATRQHSQATASQKAAAERLQALQTEVATLRANVAHHQSTLSKAAPTTVSTSRPTPPAPQPPSSTNTTALASPNGGGSKRMPKGIHSFKLLTECPIVIVLLYQLYNAAQNDAVRTRLPDFIPLAMKVLSFAPQALKSLPPNLMEAFKDFVAAQVKTLSFLAYMLNKDLGDHLRRHRDELSGRVLQLLRMAPGSNAGIRKELLLATRHILSSEFRSAFASQLDTLLDTNILTSEGWTSREVLRPLAATTIADLVHNLRMELTDGQLTTAINVFLRNIQDNSVSLAIQTMSCKLLFNLIEVITTKVADKAVARQHLLQILGVFVGRLGSLSKWNIPRVLADVERRERAQMKSDQLPANSDSDTARAQSTSTSGHSPHPHLNDDTQDESSDEINADDFSEHISETITDLDPSLKTIMKARQMSDAHVDSAKDIAFLLRSIIQGLRSLLWAIGMCNSSLSQTTDRLVNSEETHVFFHLLKHALPCFLIYRVQGDRRLRSLKGTAKQPIKASKDEKDCIEHLAGVFAVVDVITFREVMHTKISFLVDQAIENNLLIAIPQHLLSNPKVTTIFGAAMLKELVERLPDVGRDDENKSTVILRLFKLVFSSVNLFPEHNEMVLQPYLQRIVKDCIRLASTSQEGVNYLLILRALFRSIGGGKFEVLYREFLPLLPQLLSSINRMHSGANGRQMQDVLVELCLTVPVRLSSLLPYLRYLMKPLVNALNSNNDLVSQGLRTLELCIDNLTHEFLDPVVEPVRDELMNALHAHLGKTENPQHAKNAARILGKMGGKSRFLMQPAVLEPAGTNATVPTASLSFDKARSIDLPLLRAIESTELVFKRPLLAEDAEEVPEDAVDRATRQSGLSFLRYCLSLAVDAAPAGQLSATLAGLTLEDGPTDDYVPSVTFREVPDPDDPVRACILRVLQALAVAKASDPVVTGEAEELLRQTVLHLATLCCLLHPRHLERVSAPNDLARADVVIDFILWGLKHRQREYADLCLSLLEDFWHACTTCMGRPALCCQLPCVERLLQEVCGACFDKEWYNKSACIIILEKLGPKLPRGTMVAYASRVVQGLLFLRLDLEKEISAGITDRVEKLLKDLLDTCFDGVEVKYMPPIHSSASAAGTTSNASDASAAAQMETPIEKSFWRVVFALGDQMTSGSDEVRSLVVSSLERLSELSKISVCSLLQRTEVVRRIAPRTTRSTPISKQIGRLHALTYCLQLEPPLLDFVPPDNDDASSGLEETAASSSQPATASGAPTTSSAPASAAASTKDAGVDQNSQSSAATAQSKQSATPSTSSYVQELIQISKLDDKSARQIARSQANISLGAMVTLRAKTLHFLSVLATNEAWKGYARKIAELLIRSLTSSHDEIVDAALQGLKRVQIEKRLSSEDLQTVLKLLLDLNEYSKLSVPKLRSLSMLLSVVPNSCINGPRLSDKLFEHFKQAMGHILSSTSATKWSSMDTAGISTSLVELLATVGPDAERLLPHVIKHVADAEAKIGRYMTSSFRPPLAKLCAAFPRAALSFFLENFANSAYFRLLHFLLRLPEGEPLRKELAAQPQLLVDQVFQPCETGMRSSNVGSLKSNYAVTAFNGVAIVRTLYQKVPQVLRQNNQMLYSSVVNLWSHVLAFLRSSNASPLGPGNEIRLMLHVLLAYFRADPTQIDLLFNIMTVFSYRTTLDLAFLRNFFYHELPDLLPETTKHELLRRYLDMIPASDVTQSLKIIVTEMLIVPMLAHSAREQKAGTLLEARVPAPAPPLQPAPTSAAPSSTGTASANATGSHPRKQGTEPDEDGPAPKTAATTFVQRLAGVLVTTGWAGFGDGLKISMLQLLSWMTAIAKHDNGALDVLKPLHKEYLGFVWNSCFHGNSGWSIDDITVKHGGAFVLALMVDIFNYIQPEVMTAIYNRFVTDFSVECRHLIQQGQRLVQPLLAKMPSSADPAEWVKCVTTELNGENPARTQNIWSAIVDHPDMFFEYRHQLVSAIVHSLARVVQPASNQAEFRRLSLDVAETIVRWDIKANDAKRQHNQQQGGQPKQPLSEAVLFKTPRRSQEVIISLLMHTGMQVSDSSPATAEAVSKRCLGLLSRVLTRDMWLGAAVSVTRYDRQLQHVTEDPLSSVRAGDVAKLQQVKTLIVHYKTALKTLVLLLDRLSPAQALSVAAQIRNGLAAVAKCREETVGSAFLEVMEKVCSLIHASNLNSRSPSSLDAGSQSVVQLYREWVAKAAERVDNEKLPNSHAVVVLKQAQVIAKYQHSFVPDHIASIVKLLQRVQKEHLTPPSSSASTATPAPSPEAEATVVRLVCMSLELLAPYLKSMEGATHRKTYIAAVAALLEKSTSPVVMEHLLKLLDKWVLSSDIDSALPLKEKAALMHKAQLTCTRRFLKHRVFYTFLDTVMHIFQQKPLANTDLTQRLEAGFMMGLRVGKYSVRERFFEVYDRPNQQCSVFDRLDYCFSDKCQRWETSKAHFWVKHCLDVVLAGASSASPLRGPDRLPRLPQPGLVSSTASMQMSFGDDDPRRAIADKLRNFVETLSGVKNADLIKSLRTLCYVDVDLANELWITVFPRVWQILSNTERKPVAKNLHNLLQQEFLQDQSSLRPNNAAALVIAISRCTQPVPTMTANLLHYLAKTHCLWHTALHMLSYQASRQEKSDKAAEGKLDLLKDTLADLYLQLREHDSWFGCWRLRGKMGETATALAWQQLGYYDRAQATYERVMHQLQRQGSQMREAEFKLWETNWVECSRQLLQYDILQVYADEMKHQELLLETHWKLRKWKQLKDVTTKLEHQRDPFQALKLSRGYLSCIHGDDVQTNQIDKASGDAWQLALQSWRSLPDVVGNAHQSLLCFFQRLVELQESAQLLSIVQNGRPASPEMTGILEAWRQRLPNEWDDLTVWDDLLSWRMAVFEKITGLAASKKAPSTPNLGSYVSLAQREQPALRVKLASMARAHKLKDVCQRQLVLTSKLHLDHGEVYAKSRELALCEIQLNPEGHAAQLDVLDSVNFSHLNPDQSSELLSLKATALHRKGDFDQANVYFSAALSVSDNIADAWESWAAFSDHMFLLAREQVKQRSGGTAKNPSSKAGETTSMPASSAAAAGVSTSTSSSARSPATSKTVPHPSGRPSSKTEDLSTLKEKAREWGVSAVTCSMTALRSYTSPHKTRMLVGRLLTLLGIDDDQRSLAEAFVQLSDNVDVNVWKPWIPQLLTGLQRAEARPLLTVILRLTKSVPQAVYNHLRIAYLDARNNVATQSRNKTGEAGASGNESDEPAAKRAKSDSNDASEDSPQSARLVLQYVSTAMQQLRNKHGMIASVLEALIEQIIGGFKPDLREELLRTTHVLLQECFKQAFVLFDRDPAQAAHAEAPVQVRVHISRLLQSFFSPENSAISDFATQFRDSFRDVDHMTLDACLRQLRYWHNFVESRVASLPRRQRLEEISGALAAFPSNEVDIDVPGEHLLEQAPGQHLIKIERFLPHICIMHKHSNSFRRLVILGRNGKEYPFLIQHAPSRNARSEERFLQMLRMFNAILDKKKEPRRRNLNFFVPRIVPLSQHVRLVEDNHTQVSMGEVLDNSLAARKLDTDAPVMYCYEQRRREAKKPAAVNEAQKKTIFDHIRLNMVPSEVFTTYMRSRYPDHSAYWTFQKRFTAQLSLTAFATHVFLFAKGPPHTMRFVLETGDLWMADISPSLDGQGHFTLLDRVPFRLTPNVVNFVTPTGITGIFTTAMVAAAQALADNEFKITHYFGAIIRDEMIAWHQYHTTAGQPPISDEELALKVSRNMNVIRKRLLNLSSFEGTFNSVDFLIKAATGSSNLCTMLPTLQPWF